VAQQARSAWGERCLSRWRWAGPGRAARFRAVGRRVSTPAPSADRPAPAADRRETRCSRRPRGKSILGWRFRKFDIPC